MIILARCSENTNFLSGKTYNDILENYNEEKLNKMMNKMKKNMKMLFFERKIMAEK